MGKTYYLTYELTRVERGEIPVHADNPDAAAEQLRTQRWHFGLGGEILDVKVSKIQTSEERHHYGEEYLHDETGDKDSKHDYSFITDFDKIDEYVGCPQDEGCYWYGEQFEKAGMVTKDVLADHESGGCYFYFKTAATALTFLSRLNEWIDKRHTLVQGD